MQILYVEDDPGMARIVEQLLRQCGHQFDTVNCGKDAIAQAERARYDLILLDIMLPDIDGYEVITQLRRKGIETPFLVQTGLLDHDDAENNGASLGVSEYLIKPFNKAELIAGIEAVVGRSRQVLLVTDGPMATDDRARAQYRGEKRKHRRFLSERHVQVVAPQPFECRILNMSHGGAALRLPHPQRELPSQFRLSVGFGPALDCHVCWRTNDKVGVKFL